MAQQIDLASVADDLSYALEQFRQQATPSPLTEEYALLMQTAWRQLRRKGIAHMLTDADRPAFLGCLEQAGTLRARLLLATQGMQSQPAFSDACRLSDVGPFFDALASGSLGCAVEIASKSEATFSRRYEYEEDYCYAQCLFAITLGAEASILETKLAQFDQATDGDEPPRYRACVALATQYESGFEVALERLIEEHEEKYRDIKKSMVIDIEGFATEQFVMVEGLGLKVLAVERGMSPQLEHTYMPVDAYARAPGR